MVLLDNREVRNGWARLKQTVAGLFEKHGSQMLSARRWDERRLAYPIKRQLRGTYLLCYHKTDTDAMPALRRDLEYSEPILRYLSMVCEEVPESAYDPEEAFDETAVRVDDEPSPAPAPSAQPETAVDSSEDENAAGDASEKEGSDKDAAKADAAKEDAPKAEASKPDAAGDGDDEPDGDDEEATK
jgi:small subunit ribosomal protein S6